MSDTIVIIRMEKHVPNDFLHNWRADAEDYMNIRLSEMIGDGVFVLQFINEVSFFFHIT